MTRWYDARCLERSKENWAGIEGGRGRKGFVIGVFFAKSFGKMIILLGGTGYVGGAFQRFFASRGIACRVLSRSTLDYTKSDPLIKVLQETKPEFVINAAGFTGKPNVDACEDQKLACLEGNVTFPGMIAGVCSELGIPWGQVSSGCIYTGRRKDGYGFTEEDVPNFDFRHNNCSFYSGTKALGEEILKDYPEGYQWRLRIPFNEVDSPRNYLSKIMSYRTLLEVENSISQLDEFVRACFECWEKRVPFGVYNVVNPGVVKTSEVVELIRRAGFCPEKEIRFFQDEAEFMEQAARTPRSSCVIDPTKILKTGIQLTEVHEAIEWSLRHWEPSLSLSTAPRG